MASPRAPRGPVFFGNPEEFRAWLEKHGAKEGELLVGFHKVGTGKPSLTWPQSVDEALCFGWIDGVRKRIDDGAYQIRFTPRKAKSTWSAVNVRRVEALVAEGRMRPAGLEAFARRLEANSGIYSYEQAAPLALTPDEVKAFRRNKAAWAYFEAVAPSYRKAVTHWIASAKKEETRARRLAKLIESCAAGVRLLA
jgi:uncharacterized protein YdeI (YjbR/CyaY-like superfamily)